MYNRFQLLILFGGSLVLILMFLLYWGFLQQQTVIIPTVILSNTNYSWVSTDISKWYSPAQLCVLNGDSDCNAKDEDVGVKIFKRNCNFVSKEKQPYLFQAMTDYDEPHAKHLLSILRYVFDRNMTFIIMGDSLSDQCYTAALLEIIRQDPNAVIRARTTPDEASCHPTFEDPMELHGRTDCGVNMVKLSGMTQFQPVYFLTDRKAAGHEQLAYLEQLYDGMVLIYNAGVHLNDQKTAMKLYHYHMQLLLPVINKPHKNNIVFWRETTAQHFNNNTNPNG